MIDGRLWWCVVYICRQVTGLESGMERKMWRQEQGMSGRRMREWSHETSGPRKTGGGAEVLRYGRIKMMGRVSSDWREKQRGGGCCE